MSGVGSLTQRTHVSTLNLQRGRGREETGLGREGGGRGVKTCYSEVYGTGNLMHEFKF